MNGYANFDINNESDYDSDQNKETNPRISKKKKMRAKITNFVLKKKNHALNHEVMIITNQSLTRRGSQDTSISTNNVTTFPTVY